MTTLSDFQSLLQLGAGLGVGLSFFRAGADRKTRSLRSRFNSLAATLRSPSNAAERKRLTTFAGIRTRFFRACAETEKLVPRFQGAALFGGIVNIYLLGDSTINPSNQLTAIGVAAYFWWSVGYFLALLLALEGFQAWRFRKVERDLLDLNGA